MMGTNPPPSNCYQQGGDWNVCIDNEYAFPDCATITYTTDLTNSDFDGQTYPIYAHVTVPATETAPSNFEPLMDFKSSSFDKVDEFLGSNNDKYIYVFKIEADDQQFDAKFNTIDGAVGEFQNTNISYRTGIQPSGTLIVAYGDGTSVSAWGRDYIITFISISSISTSETYSGNKIHIEPSGTNTFNVDNDLTIEQNSLLYIDENTLIKVKNGSTLKVTDSEVRGCGRMWEAIEVESGGTLIIKNSTIQDGYQAIKVNPGANLTLEDNTFINNFIGLYADDAISDQLITLDDVYSNTFKTDNNEGFLEEPSQKSNDPLFFDSNSKSYAGLYFKDCEVEFMTSIAHYDDDLNLFQKLHHGVVIDKSEVDMRTCQFKDILNSTSSSNIHEGAAVLQKGGDLSYYNISLGVTETIIDNCTHGFLGLEPGFTNFNYATIDNCRTGIRLENTKYAAGLRSNEITNSQTGIYIRDDNRVTTNVKVRYNDVSVSYRGIVLAGRSAKIRGNEVNLDASGFSDPEYSAGILTFSISLPPDSEIHSFRRPAVVANEVNVDYGKKGIYINSGHSFHILDNTVTFNGHMYSEVANSSGIHLFGGKNHRVKGNCVYNADGDDNNPDYESIFRNIYIEESPGVVMQCNFVESYAAYSKNLINFAGQGLMSTIRGNMITELPPSNENYTTDLQLGRSDNGRCMVGEQYYTGNMWAYSSAGASPYNRATHLSSIRRDYVNSEFYMDKSISNGLPVPYDDLYIFKADPNTGDFTWINHQSEPQGTETYLCDTVPICIRASSDTIIVDGGDLPPIVMDSLLHDVVDDDPAMNDSLYNFLWKGQRYLISEVEHAVVRSYTDKDLSTFASNYSNSDFGELSEVRANLSRDLYQSDSIIADEIGYWSESSFDIDSVDWDSINHNVVNTTDSLREEDWSDFKSSTNSISTSNPCGNNEIDVNLAFANNAIDTVTPMQVEDMEELALQCPYVEGNAVYEAVALLEYEGLLPDSTNYCSNEAVSVDLREYKPQTDPSSIAYKVFPNPANDHINIFSNVDQLTEFFIYNSVGVLVKKGSFKQTIQINLTDINGSGIFYIKFIDNRGNSCTSSFIVE
jgi:hypothetical protein